MASAVQILCVIAYKGEGGTNSEIIAGSLRTNPVVVRRLLKCMEHEGLVEIRPGKDGGVQLLRDPDSISLDQIYRAVESDTDVFALRPRGNRHCPVDRRMKELLSPVFAATQNAVERTLRQTTLGQPGQGDRRRMNEFSHPTRHNVVERPASAATPASVRRAATTPNQVLAIVCVGICLANLDLFIVNVGLPNIAHDFQGASLEDLSWILNGYAIVYAALLVFFGRLAERYRRDRSFLLGVALFTAASAACSAAEGVATLVAFRVVQAAGAALMTPTSIGLLLASFPPDRRGSAVRTWAAIGGLAAALGPVVGGVLVTASWRWIFIVNVPIGLIAMAVGWWKLPHIAGPQRRTAGPVGGHARHRRHRRADVRHREGE